MLKNLGEKYDRRSKKFFGTKVTSDPSKLKESFNKIEENSSIKTPRTGRFIALK